MIMSNLRISFKGWIMEEWKRDKHNKRDTDRENEGGDQSMSWQEPIHGCTFTVSLKYS